MLQNREREREEERKWEDRESAHEREKERERGVASKSKEEEGMTLKVSDAICGKRICESAKAGARERADGARSAITQRTLPLYLLAHSALHDVSVPPEEMYFAQPHL